MQCKIVWLKRTKEDDGNNTFNITDLLGAPYLSHTLPPPHNTPNPSECIDASSPICPNIYIYTCFFPSRTLYYPFPTDGVNK